jgi:crotonobetainyl-CoA:carnitine CoA-transferase CaiB-like acyl-CoA transferase
MPVALVDLLAAHQLKEGLLLALLRRQGSGAGSYVSTSLLGSAAASLANQASNYLHAGVVPVRMGSEHPNIVPYGNIFPTRDGRDFVIAVGTEPQFRAFVAAVGRPELAQDARFVSNTERVRHRLQLNELLGGILSGWDSDDLDQRLRAARVPFGFLNDIDQVFAQPAARAQLLAGGRGVRTIAFTDAPGRLAGRAGLTPPPHLDQHGAEVRAWLAAAG